MSTKEKAFYIFNQLTEKQLNAFITLFENQFQSIPEDMNKSSQEDNEESIPLDEFVKELGFNPNDLRI